MKKKITHNKGYYKDIIYPHNQYQEKPLFKISLNDYIKNKEGEIQGIEIGVLNGETTSFLLGINNKITLVGIDPIIPDSMNIKLIGDIKKIKSNTGRFGDRFKFINDYSYNVIDEISNNIDFIFIDGSHHYEDAKQDYELYFNKIVKGGLIYFHDSRMNRGGAPWHVGCSQLVDEIIKEDKRIELIGEAFSLTCFIKK